MPQDSDDVLLSRRLVVAVFTPVALLLVVGVLLTIQIVRMNDTARWVDHTDDVIGRIGDLQRQIIDQETAVRGYLLTTDRAFLEPYERAQPVASFDALGPLVDDAAQQALLTEVRQRYLAWLAATTDLVRPGAALDAYRRGDTLLERKGRMDRVRAAITEMLHGEEALRRERVKLAEETNRQLFWGGGGIFLALAAALAFVSRWQIGAVARVYDGLVRSERSKRQQIEAEAWVRARHMALMERVRGDRVIEDLGAAALEELAKSTGAVVGAFYIRTDHGWDRRAGYALDASSPARFREGEGLVGQAGRDQKMLRITDAPADFLRVRSGTAERSAVEVVLAPACVEGETQAVLELGFLSAAPPRALDLIERVSEPLGVAVRSAAYRLRLRALLEQSQQQAEELQAQQEELRVTNEELQHQGDALRVVQAQLEERKEELEASNGDLEAQRDALQRTQRDLAEEAEKVARASQYKSEFLANMSHELRTPLNSTLILARLLADNASGNLTPEQMKFAETIYSAGNDLLLLINDILDLSKIEAGKVDVRVERVTIAAILDPVTSTFEPVAREKGLAFDVDVEDPGATLETDRQRLQQILKNLLSNAFKFTEKGGVSLRVARAAHGFQLSVRDTGIGIARHQQEIIFEAFRQADGTTNRKFGGTGLGLSISRDLAKHLGGELRVESAPGAGSTFTLTLPERFVGTVDASRSGDARVESRPSAASVVALPRAVRRNLQMDRPPSNRDDRARVEPNHRMLLVIEDDVAFAEILANLARELEFQCLVADTANDGVRLALEHHPSAILLDMQLPDHSGLSVIDRLKRNTATRHIPIHVLSAHDHAHRALLMGATGYLRKPASRDELVAVLERLRAHVSRMRRLLIVEDDPVQREAIRHLLATDDVDIVSVETIAAALDQLGASTFDCVITDLKLPDASGFELLERMASDDRYSFPPVVVYTGASLSAEDEQRLRRYSSSIIVKGARSPERLLDEVTLFLHQVEAGLPTDSQRLLRHARDREAVFAGRKILLAEDDVRNVFALTSVLESKGARLVVARNGREALEMLDVHADIDLVLMDIMMPEVDGLAAMKAIRARGGRFIKLPILALTAKAMPDDHARCLAAGASDYLSKPLDVEMLLSLLRVWMPK